MHSVEKCWRKKIALKFWKLQTKLYFDEKNIFWEDYYIIQILQ